MQNIKPMYISHILSSVLIVVSNILWNHKMYKGQGHDNLTTSNAEQNNNSYAVDSCYPWPKECVAITQGHIIKGQG